MNRASHRLNRSLGTARATMMADRSAMFLAHSHTSALNQSATRNGSTTTKERLVILPDKPGVLAQRVLIRPKHSPNFVRLHNEGYVSWAGPVFDQHVDRQVPVSQRPFKGSVMVVNDGSWEGFMDKVGSDMYIKEAIWDLDKTLFVPFRTLLRRENVYLE